MMSSRLGLFVMAVAAVAAVLSPCLCSPDDRRHRRRQLAAPNGISEVRTACNATHMQVALQMRLPFKGLVATKHFSHECRSEGTLENVVQINIPASGCGVRLNANSSDGRLYYAVTVVAQQDKHLRQITDQEQLVRCFLRDKVLSLKSEPMFRALQSEVNQMGGSENRKGRMRTGWPESTERAQEQDVDKELANVLGEARAWMEISPAESQSVDSVQVGEATTLSVKSTLPVGIGWRVIDCSAHDGIGEVSQKLLDDDGCPIDTSILPGLTIMKPKMLGNENELLTMRHQEAVTSFAAFKFPDRDRLHINCGLQLCRGQCTEVNCFSGETGKRQSRNLKKGERGEVLDRLEVFNSVEVLAPGIELDDYRTSDLITDGVGGGFPGIPGDRPFCVSPNKMALAFCVLGLVFLAAVLVALCSLMRARRSGDGRAPYYSRSLFSSTDSTAGGSAYAGSKTLLNDSPTLGQTRHWRIL